MTIRGDAYDRVYPWLVCLADPDWVPTIGVATRNTRHAEALPVAEAERQAAQVGRELAERGAFVRLAKEALGPDWV